MFINSRNAHLLFKLKVTFFIFLFIPLSSCNAEDITQIQNLPYDAQTIDECIDEKTCLEYVFLNEIIRDYGNFTDQQRQNFRLERWKGPIDIALFGTAPELKEDLIEYGLSAREATRALQSSFPHPIQFTEDYGKMNVALIYGDNLERDIAQKKKDLLLFFSPEFVKVIEDNTVQYPKVLKVSEKGVNYLGAILVEQEGKGNSCFLALFTNLLGVNHTPSKHFNLVDYDDCRVTIMHKFILSILQSREIKPGATVSEIESVFNSTYTLLKDSARTHLMTPSTLLREREAYAKKGLHIIR